MTARFRDVVRIIRILRERGEDELLDSFLSWFDGGAASPVRAHTAPKQPPNSPPAPAAAAPSKDAIRLRAWRARRKAIGEALVSWAEAIGGRSAAPQLEFAFADAFEGVRGVRTNVTRTPSLSLSGSSSKITNQNQKSRANGANARTLADPHDPEIPPPRALAIAGEGRADLAEFDVREAWRSFATRNPRGTLAHWRNFVRREDRDLAAKRRALASGRASGQTEVFDDELAAPPRSVVRAVPRERDPAEELLARRESAKAMLEQWLGTATGPPDVAPGVA